MALKSLLQNVLRNQKGLEELDIFEVEEVPCTKPGDNYMSVVSLVKIKGNLPGEVAYDSSVFVKRQPESSERRHTFQTDVAFHNECVMYESILPSYDVSVGCPGSLYVSRDLIVLKNLRAEGYEMVDRRTGFDLDQSILILKALARFHAASYHSLTTQNEKFASAVRQLKRVGFMVSAHRDMVESAMHRGVRYLQGKGVEEAVEFLKGLQGHFSEHLRSLMEPKGLQVLCHGDFWVNNVLIREGEDPVKIVDFQNCGVCSAAVDVWSFLYTSVNLYTMENGFSQLIETYCKAFREELANLKLPEDKIPPAANVMSELRSKEHYGFLVSIMYIPALIMAEDNIPDFDSLPKEFFLDENYMDQFMNTEIKDRMCYSARFARGRGLFNTDFNV